MSTENKKESCLHRDSAEREEYAGARRSFRRIWKERDSAEPELLEAILDRRNMNKAVPQRLRLQETSTASSHRTKSNTRSM